MAKTRKRNKRSRKEKCQKMKRKINEKRRTGKDQRKSTIGTEGRGGGEEVAKGRKCIG
jgi:hypothetical protein